MVGNTAARGVWSDAPGESIDEGYDRTRFLHLLTSKIRAVEVGQSSTVFGLVGPWGSGKTTLIEQVEANLRSDSTWDVVRFAPWAATDQQGVVLEFLKTLNSLNSDEKTNSKKLRDALNDYSEYAIPLLSLIPFAGAPIGRIAETAVKQFAGDPPWIAQFHKLSSVFGARSRRVLVVTDDIDRLDADELLVLLKVIRLLGRFPNIHYLLAYDQSSIEQLLNAKGLGGQSSSFMEKIVQVPFEVPILPAAERRRVMASIIDEALRLAEFNLNDNIGSARSSELLGLLADGIHTPRGFARFREQLIAHFEHIDFQEIDPLDFIALTYLRLFEHRVWESIWSWRSDLLLTDSDEEASFSSKVWTTRLRPLTQSSDLTNFVRVLAFMFTRVTYRDQSWQRSHPLAIENAEYFERYGTLDVVGGDIRDRTVDEALTALLTGNTESSSITLLEVALDSEDDASAGYAFEKCLRARESATQTSAELIAFLISRYTTRQGSSIRSSSAPLAGLRRWISGELSLGVRQQIISASDLTRSLGVIETVTLLASVRSRNVPAGDISAIFNKPVFDAVSSAMPELIQRTGQLSRVMTSAREAGLDLSGVADALIGDDLETFVKVAAACVSTVNEFGTQGWSFDQKAFTTAVSESLIRRLGAELPPRDEPSSIANRFAKTDRFRYALDMISVIVDELPDLPESQPA